MEAKRVNPRHISYLCIALCIIFAGGYALRQNYLLNQAYQNAVPYDYIPAGEIHTILVTTPTFPCDSTVILPYGQQARMLAGLWEEVRSVAGLPRVDTLVFSFTTTGEPALWYHTSKAEQKRLTRQLPRLLSNNYRPVSERVGRMTVRHYALHNGNFLHTFMAPGVIAFSFESALFREALQTVDVLSRREQFTKTLHSLDPQAPARLLQQVNDLGYRSSGRWKGMSLRAVSTQAAPADSATLRP
ncbi:hypothetical protein [Barnesiella viscericola]|uniref:hypothetical protein n=1 Tax=Barnesiella viscericola TaxID=397865 RepID=UPI00235623A2|nr:hypothetical protein [Barnesiella viscericola]